MGGRLKSLHIRNRYLLFTLVMTYFVHYLVKQTYGDYGPVRDYMGDLLCMPIVLTTALLVLQFAGRYGSRRLSTGQVAGATLLFSLFFEWYAPARLGYGTADALDVLFYMLGAALFCLWINPEKDQSERSMA